MNDTIYACTIYLTKFLANKWMESTSLTNLTASNQKPDECLTWQKTRITGAMSPSLKKTRNYLLFLLLTYPCPWQPDGLDYNGDCLQFAKLCGRGSRPPFLLSSLRAAGLNISLNLDLIQNWIKYPFIKEADVWQYFRLTFESTPAQACVGVWPIKVLPSEVLIEMGKIQIIWLNSVLVF